MSNTYFVATMNRTTFDVKVLGEYSTERAQQHLDKFKGDTEIECKVYGVNGFKDEYGDQWAVFNRIETAMQPVEHHSPIIIMQDNSTWLYTYFKTLEAAEAKLTELNAEGEKTYSITTWADYDKRQRDSFLGKCEEVTRSYYWDKLECLPPMRWGNNEGVYSFFMSEFNSGSYTEQLAEHNDKFYAKSVDYADRTTWIKTSEFENAPFNERSKEWGE